MKSNYFSGFNPRRRYSLLLVFLVCSYFVVFVYYDKYLFESTIFVLNWVTTNGELRKAPASQRLFKLDERLLESENGTKQFLILYWMPFFGQVYKSEHVCPGCLVTYDRSVVSRADAVVFHCAEMRDDPSWLPWQHRSEWQRWVWMCMEPPWNVRHVFQKTLTPLNGVFNWTMTYRTDSDILASYELVDMEPDNTPAMEWTRRKNASALGVWVVSNCHAAKRRELITNLSKYITIDEFGHCSKRVLCKEKACQARVLSQYKFYFALENSQCKDYISEKFWRNGLASQAVPVVMGPSRADYEFVAPPHSFVHVDDFASARQLADYLIELDQDDAAYSKYLEWRLDSDWKRRQIAKARQAKATGLLNSRLYNKNKIGICGLCNELRRGAPVKTVEHLDSWWFGPGYSPGGNEIPLCARDTRSGFPLRWVITLAYSLLFWGAVLAVTCRCCCLKLLKQCFSTCDTKTVIA